MGIVYKARDSVLGRLVALKVMTSGLADNAEVRERFLREARSVSDLQHANIVVVHELGEHAGMPYIVMEYLDGETLEVTIRNRRPLIVLQKIDIILQVAKALHYAHEKEVIHREVKPGNRKLLLDGSIKWWTSASPISPTKLSAGLAWFWVPLRICRQNSLMAKR